MAISFFQKMRLVLRGWSRRRDDRQQEFLRRNAAWTPAVATPQPQAQPQTAPLHSTKTIDIDLEGLQAAYLDGSGQIAYYLDIENGEVVDVRDGATMDPMRYKRVPNGGNDLDERRAFIATLDATPARASLMKNVASQNFRSVLAEDRAIERAWYNFKNDRATAAIEAWLKQSGLR
jgi:hypothetical protein